MTAGHDSFAGNDGCESYDGHDGADALMAAITGEDPPDAARADAAFLADHRRAAADVTLLREQLRMIGEALAEPPTPPAPADVRAPAPVRPPRVRRRVRAFAFGALAAAAVATVLTGMGWLAAQGGSGASSDAGGGDAKTAPDAGSLLADPGYLACARVVAEGAVTGVEQLPAGTGQERIVLHVNRSYKPERTKREITFLLDEGMVLKGLHKGDRVLVVIPQHSATPDQVLVGERAIARERPALTRALSTSREIACE
ncbi:hypothetical protein [Streptomyces sp. H51]|uniref:hypothetical protein n=1 Tax=Streptomyces sp. H51 TaxID=3111770 RepID=UPI002D77481A|nr:hypothetical protein [Streptomyces sp. H51]